MINLVLCVALAFGFLLFLGPLMVIIVIIGVSVAIFVLVVTSTDSIALIVLATRRRTQPAQAANPTPAPVADGQYPNPGWATPVVAAGHPPFSGVSDRPVPGIKPDSRRLLTPGEVVLHIILQLIFVADVVDAVYLFVAVGRRAKALS